MPRDYLSIEIDYNVDDRWGDLNHFCRDEQKCWDFDSKVRWKLDFRKCRYLGPYVASVLYATWLRSRQLGQHPTVALPTEPRSLDAFCHFSNLKHFLLKKGQADPRHTGNETVPLYQFFDHAYEQTIRILKFVKEHQSLTDDDEITLTSAIHEVCQNIEDHADSPVGGISCARYFSQRRKVRVAVVDMGITIAASLRRNREIGSDVEALELVSRGGITSGIHKHNKGQGISNLVMFVRAMNGTLEIVSGSAVVKCEPQIDKLKTEPLDWRFPGTGVFFTLTVSQADDDTDEHG